MSEYKSSDPQRGIAFLPKRGINVHENEVMRAFKTVNDSYIEPIPFIVPRRAEVFQDDIYPPTVGLKPATTSGGWFGGKDGVPPKIDLAAVYAGEEPSEVPSDYTPPVQEPPKQASPVKKPEPEPTSEPATVSKGPPPSMKEQTANVRDLASKYDDEDEDDAPDDDSSFEEVSQPVDRSARQPAIAPSSQVSQPPASGRSLGDTLSPSKDKPDDFDVASQVAASQSTETQIKSQAEPLSQTKPEPIKEQLPSSSRAESTHEPEVQASLAEIKSLLVQQSKTMNAQNDTIAKLTAEVDRLRSKLGE